jgi:SAM-dependent methyltransferase
VHALTTPDNFDTPAGDVRGGWLSILEEEARMSRAETRHPLFARFYTRLSAAAETAGAAAHRQELLNGLTGRVIEVGAGHGLNFRHYPATVTEVVAVEPEPFLRTRAARAAADAAVSIRVVDGTAEALPFDDEIFDAGVASLVLCSVPSLAAALAELRRVLRPGAELRFYEHVLARDRRWARRQHWAGPLWSRFWGWLSPGSRHGYRYQRGWLLGRALPGVPVRASLDRTARCAPHPGRRPPP